MKPLAILGLDPGTTSAYAALDLNGKLLKSNSGKEFTLSQIIAEIIEFCQPVIASTDKSRIPSFVEEFARKMGAVIVFPKEDMKKEEKHQLVGVGYKGDHEEDALAAALFAYRTYFSRLVKIRKFVRENQLERLEEEFTKLAIKEELNFTAIKELLMPKTETPERAILTKVIKENRITKKDFLSLNERLSFLKEEKEFLIKRISQLKNQLRTARKENKQLHRRSRNFYQKLDELLKFKEERLKLQAKELSGQSDIISHLNQKILSLYSFIEKMSQYRLLKKLSTLSYQEFLERNRILNIEDNDVLFVGNPNIFSERVLDELAGRGIVIVSPVKTGEVIRSKFRTLHLTEEIPYENEYFGLVKREAIKREAIESNLKEKDFIEGIIQEYREKRG